MRAFVAIPLDEAVRAALAGAPVPESGPGVRVRRVPAHNLHLTLKFLGDVDDERRAAVTRAVSAASAGVRPFRMRVRGLGRFPPRGPARILWAGCDGGTELERLHARIDDVLAALGFPREERAFRPHVTLARIEHRRGAGPARGAGPDADEVRAAATSFGEMSVDDCCILESRLGAGPDGSSLYRVCSTHAFGA